MANSHPQSVLCVQMFVSNQEITAEHKQVTHKAKGATVKKQKCHTNGLIQYHAYTTHSVIELDRVHSIIYERSTIPTMQQDEQQSA